MKKFVLPALGLLASLMAAQAQQFTAGDLAVLRISGNTKTTGDGAAVYIDEYTTNGTLVNSFAVPASGSDALILSGEPYEGYLTLTPDGNHLVFAGFNTPAPYSAELITSTSTAVPRVVATLDAYGNFALPISSTSIFTGKTITSAVSDGSNYWAGGITTTGGASVDYLGTASAPTEVTVLTGLYTSGFHSLNLYNDALYTAGYESATTVPVGAGSGATMLTNIGGALPTSASGYASVTFPTGTSAASTASDVVVSPDGTVAYVADYSFGIVKFTNPGGTGWVSNYTILLTNGTSAAGSSLDALSVTADFTQNPVVIYATTGEFYTNRLVSVQDTGTAAGANATIANLAYGSLVSSGTGAATNTLRGVRFVPNAYAYISVPPSSVVENPGDTATFSVTALGTPAPTYQWYSNSVAVPDATTSKLSVTDVTTAESGSQFYVVVANTFGTSQSAPVSLTILDPSITTEPVGSTNVPGAGSVSLCVTAAGTGTLTYQWLANGAPIPGAQSACYTAPDSSVADTTSYSVVVSNSLGESITSAPTAVSFSPYLVFDTFDYANGILFKDAGSPWTEESGTKPINTTNASVQINETIGSLGTAFGQSLYSQPQAEGSTVLWASFIINLQTLPATTSGTYFAYFQSTNFNFYGRVIALTSNNPALTPDMSPVAYPGTYRIGIANNATTASAVVELDMAPGIDYQVVEYYDMVNQFCQLAVNPSPTNYVQVYSPGVNTPTALVSGVTSDSFTPTTLPMAAYGLRQAANVGVMDLTDLEVSYDWNGAGSGYTAVTAKINPSLPVIGLVTPGITNYAGNSNVLEVAASGVGLTYAWYQNGVALSDGGSVLGSATPLLTLNPLADGNTGSYTVVVTSPSGSVTSSVVPVSVNTTPTAPIFTVEPVSTVSSLGANVTFTASAYGTGPITYEWYQNGSDYGVSGPVLALTRVTTNMSGFTYSVVATGGTGLTTTSTNAVLTVNGPIVTNIAFLRSLQVTNAAPTITIPAASSVPVYEVTGVVITSTNVEGATYSEYWIQDSTGGLEFFVIDPSFRPHMGDVVTVTGVVDIFDDAVELDGSANNPAEPYYIDSTNGENMPLPYPAEVIPFGFATANPGLSSLKYEGSLGVFTNVYFTTPGAVITDQDTITVTNSSGETYYLYTGQSDGPDLIGQTLPAFAYSVSGAYDQFDSEYELNITAGSDIVTAPPPAVTNISATLSGSNIVLGWAAVPTSYTYTVKAATNLAGPWVSLQGGLWFTNASGTYTGAISTNTPAMFFTIDSP